MITTPKEWVERSEGKWDADYVATIQREAWMEGWKAGLMDASCMLSDAKIVSEYLGKLEGRLRGQP